MNTRVVLILLLTVLGWADPLQDRLKKLREEYQARLHANDPGSAPDIKLVNPKVPLELRQAYLRDLMDLGISYPETGPGLQALTEVIDLTADPQQAESALERLEAALDRPELGAALNRYSHSVSLRLDEFCRHVVQSSRLPENRGLALRCLVSSSMVPLFISQPLDDEAETRTWLGLMASEYGQVSYGGKTLGELATNQLYQLDHLQLGAICPEIVGQDVEGRPMRLSEFQGKVVVLDFWASW